MDPFCLAFIKLQRFIIRCVLGIAEVIFEFSFAMDDSRLQWRNKSLLFGEYSFGHRFHSRPEHLFRERDRFNKDATHYSRRHHNDIGQGIESGERNSCERSSRIVLLKKSRRFPLGRPLNWMNWNFLSCVSLYNPLKSASSQHSCFKVVPKHEVSCSFQKIKSCVESDAKITQVFSNQRSGFALKNPEADYCSAVNCSTRAMGCANDDPENDFELSRCPVQEASRNDHHNDAEEGSGYKGHRDAGRYNCLEKDQDDGEEEVNKDQSVCFDVKEAFCNGEDCEDDDEQSDKEESSWASLLTGGGNCCEQSDENDEADKRDSARTGFQGGEAYCFDPCEREIEKYEEYGKGATEQGNQEDSLRRSSDDIEADFDEQCGYDDDVEENDEDNKECEDLIGTKVCKQDVKDCGEEDDDEQGGFVYRGLHAHSNGENGRQRKKELLRKFPPLLPSLARTCNLPCHMPWVLLRSYQSDGRLVIQEVKVQHHEFFRAVRSHGRLILLLVRHDEEKARAHQAEMFNAEADKSIGDQDVHPNKEERTVVEEVHEKESIAVDKDLLREENAGKNLMTGRNIVRDTERPTIEIPNAWPPSVLSRGETVPRDSGQMQMPCFSHPTSPRLQGTSSPIGMGSKGVESPVGSRCPPKPNPLFGRPLSTIRPILG